MLVRSTACRAFCLLNLTQRPYDQRQCFRSTGSFSKFSYITSKFLNHRAFMSNWVDQIDWDELIAEICLEKCVLIVGPDLISFENGQTLFQVLRQQLTHDANLKDHVVESPQYIFEHEELLQLQANKKPTRLFTFYQNFYNALTDFDEPFEKIAQLPFHLIISLLPDKRLPNKFKEMEKSRPYQFDYYTPTEKREVQEFNKTKPLVYNILGTIDDPPTYIITFDHLFNYLQGILGPHTLPLELDKRLKKATTFLFLGVHFEKWYMQVLLRIFTPQATKTNPISKYSLLQAEQANDVCTFIANRLELEFLAVKPIDFLNKLYQRFENQQSTDDKCRLIQKPAKATVFVSYSHTDNTDLKVVTQLTNALKQANIKVVIDDESMQPGTLISQFMERVQDVDKVVVILSENSLQSPYVGFEIMHSLEKKIKLIPCFLDKRFLEADFVMQVKSVVRIKIQEIRDQIKERQDADDLDGAYDLMRLLQLWQNFGRNLDELFDELQGRKCISLLPSDWETGVQQVIAAILS
ncbi:TIR domain-containing protein [Spirosoma sp. HMF4905]|uniref:TIR domain-containing protein n=1 Tax=Spirosoma arboris TaxID=2682092 RepID=A0A7K1SG85_9BACT|nr:toll/interleukin-1 receptor domain-containing protein [Spirosoma arboris]MVM32734.1 TIR domain-containing protein [Spirosoma arboris]